ncbi:MAG: DUF3078 domain-containing protein [Bradymonadia bacterium]
MKRVAAIITAFGVLSGGHALAQTEDYIKGQEVVDKMTAATDEAANAEGWKFRLEVGSNISVNSSSNVVGAVDGTTYQVGLLINGEASLKSGQHEWNNKLALNHQQTKTPSIDPFVKTADNLEITSMYLYRLESIDWLGPFARGRLQTQALNGYLIRGEQVDVVGDVNQADLGPGRRIKLTSAFEPMLLRESAGLFGRPVDEKSIRFTATLGAGAQQIVSQGGFAITDETDAADGNDKQITVTEIESTNQVGAEIEAEATGALTEQVSYTLSANLLYPIITSVDTDLEGAELLNTELNAKLAVKLSKWASLDYVLQARRIPLIVRDWQVTNGLLLSATFNVL